MEKNKDESNETELDNLNGEHPGEHEKKKAVFEDFLDVIGHFGFYQRVIFITLTLTDLPAGMSMLYFILANANPGAKCLRFAGNFSVPNNFSTGSDIMCKFNGSNCVEWEYKDDYTSIVTEWDLICDKAYLPKLTVTIQFTGLLIGSFVSSQLADILGRKHICLFVNTCMMACQACVGFASSPALYAFLRFLVGTFAGATLAINFVLPMEFIGPTWRPLASALGLYGFGHALMTLCAYYMRNWRHLSHITGLLFSPLLLMILFLVPESPRWLIQKRRFKEAGEIIKKIAKLNKKPVPDLSLMEDIALSAKEDCEHETRYSYLDLFKTKKLAITSLVCMTIWFSVSEIYYGIVVQVNSFTGDIYINTLASALTVLPVAWASFPLTHMFGRRKAFIGLVSFLMLAMFLIVILNAADVLDEGKYTVTGLALFGKCCVTALWCVVGVHTSELYPTLLRSTGLGASNIAARIGGILTPQFALLGLAIHWTLPYIIHAGLALLSTILHIIFLPETNRKPLAEVLPKRSLKHHEQNGTNRHQNSL